jgi:c-di-GMP-binding flagellar brake protein YcgR
MGIERRQYKRVDASAIIWYEITDLEKMQTGDMNVNIGSPERSIDISIGGARIFTAKEIAMDKILKVILSIPKVKEPISISAKVVWSKKTDTGGDFYVIGLQFMEFLNNKKEALTKYIEILPEMK